MPPPSNRTPAAAVIGLLGLAMTARRLRRVSVEGSSMLPALAPGDRVVAVPAWWLRPGEIVVVPDPNQPGRLLVKRATALDRRRRTVSVEGDNRRVSTDSRAFGPVDRRAIVGRVVYRYAPSERAGRLHRLAPERSNRWRTLAQRYHRPG